MSLRPQDRSCRKIWSCPYERRLQESRTDILNMQETPKTAYIAGKYIFHAGKHRTNIHIKNVPDIADRAWKEKGKERRRLHGIQPQAAGQQMRTAVRRAAAILAAVMAVSLAGPAVPAPAEAYAAAADSQTDPVSQVNKMIEELPEADQITIEDEEQVAQAQAAYDALQSSEKVRVVNVGKLTAAVQKIEFLKESGEAPQPAPEDTGEASTQAPAQEEAPQSEPAKQEGKQAGSSYEDPASNKINVEITDIRPQVTVVLFYVYDKDGDGEKDIPQITAVPPEGGKPIAISTISTSINSDDDLTANIFWDPEKVKIDFVKAKMGKWVIKTDIPVRFETRDYDGGQQRISKSEGQEDPQAIPQRTAGAPISSLIMLVLLIVFVIVMIFVLPSIAKKNRKKQEEDEQIRLNLNAAADEEDSEKELLDYYEAMENKYRGYDEGSGGDEGPEDEEDEEEDTDLEGDEGIEEYPDEDTEDFRTFRRSRKEDPHYRAEPEDANENGGGADEEEEEEEEPVKPVRRRRRL